MPRWIVFACSLGGSQCFRAEEEEMRNTCILGDAFVPGSTLTTIPDDEVRRMTHALRKWAVKSGQAIGHG
jgi:hypothetical protein